MTELKEHTLKALLENSVANYPDNPAIGWATEAPITYAEFGTQVEELKQILLECGIVSGDKVALYSENMPNWCVAYFAITTLGAVVVPILPDFHPSAVHHILRHAGCRLLFVSEKLLGRVEEFQSRELVYRICLNNLGLLSDDDQTDRVKLTLESGRKELERLKEVAERRFRRSEAALEEVTPEHLACIIYTSGTTGNSKGVMLTHGNLLFDAEAAAQVVPIFECDRFLSILPLSHTYECTLGFLLPLRWGASIAYLDRPPTAKVLIPAMAIVRPTAVLSVPLVIEKIYKMRIQPKFNANAVIRTLYKVPSIRRRLNRMAGKKLLATFGGELRFFGVGGAALAGETERFLKEAEFPYAIGYGLTETAPLVAGSTPFHTKLKAVGPIFPGIEVRIDHPDPTTEEGEIQVKGGNVMKGYYLSPELTTEVFTEDGYFRTGDLGFLDQEGVLHIRGRLKNMILGSSGENIYPEEIESIINEQDLVLESLVFTEQDRLVARIHIDYEKLDEQLTPGQHTESDQRQLVDAQLQRILAETNQKLARYSRLNRIIEQTEPFEKTPTMKIKRYLYVTTGR